VGSRNQTPAVAAHGSQASRAEIKHALRDPLGHRSAPSLGCVSDDKSNGLKIGCPQPVKQPVI